MRSQRKTAFTSEETEFRDVPLTDAMNFFSDFHGTFITLDAEALDEPGVPWDHTYRRPGRWPNSADGTSEHSRSSRGDCIILVDEEHDILLVTAKAETP